MSGSPKASFVHPYDVPSPLAHLCAPPKQRIRFLKPSPIEPWSLKGFQSADAAGQLFIKRDDSLSFVMSGSKVRALEFSLADALEKGCDCIVTIGKSYSNSCRAVAVAARRLGLEPFLILLDGASINTKLPLGNFLLSGLVGANVRVATSEDFQRRNWIGLTSDLASELEKQGRKPYIIPVGAASPVGLWGYFELALEILQQEVSLGATFDDIVVETGSGGTVAGLALALRCAGSHAKVIGVCACATAERFYLHVNKNMYSALGVTQTAEELFELIEGFQGSDDGPTSQEIDLIRRVASETGVILDPHYTVKAVMALLSHSQRFTGRRVLFLHSGGLSAIDEIAEKLNFSESLNVAMMYE